MTTHFVSTHQLEKPVDGLSGVVWVETPGVEQNELHTLCVICWQRVEQEGSPQGLKR
jgi:hypothetical protein